MIFIDEIKEQLNVMLHPGSAIKSRSVGDSLKYYYKLAFIPMVLSLILVYIAGAALGSVMSFLGMSALSSSSIMLILGLILLLILVLEPIGLFINAAILQAIGGNLFKAFKGRYNDTFSAITYASCTGILFIWVLVVPLIGFLIFAILGVWSFIIEIIGIAKMQKVSRLAAFAIIIGAGIIVGIVADFFVFGLGALFSLGAFSNHVLVGSTCVPSQGFYCSYPAYSHTTGQLTVTVGQSTGTNWEAWGIAFAPAGSNIATSGSPDVQYYAMNGSLDSGARETVALPAGANVQVGSSISGTIWTCYYTTTGAGVVGGMGSCTPANGSGQSSAYYVQIATVNAEAV